MHIWSRARGNISFQRAAGLASDRIPNGVSIEVLRCRIAALFRPQTTGRRQITVVRLVSADH
jgi:hypothetical protein